VVDAEDGTMKLYVLDGTDPLTQAYRKGDLNALQQWGGADAAFARMNELKRQSPASEAASAPCQIDSYSIWHSTRLTGINFESLDCCN